MAELELTPEEKAERDAVRAAHTAAKDFLLEIVTSGVVRYAESTHAPAPGEMIPVAVVSVNIVDRIRAAEILLNSLY